MRWLAIAVVGVLGCDGGFEGGEFIDEFPPDTFEVEDHRNVVQADDAPPPIAGGTLTISRDGRTAIMADPDHDVVWRFDVREIGTHNYDGMPIAGLLSATSLEPGDEPGRVVEDAQGRIHVVLRRGGAIASFDPSDTDDVRRAAVCPEPRGIAYDPAVDHLHVACTNGELVTLPAGGGPEVRRLLLDDDLRDVVVRGDHLLVSRFRSAALVEVDAEGAVVAYMHLQGRDLEMGRFTSSVAWRTFAAPDGSIEVVHQRGTIEDVSIEVPGGYSDGGFECASPIVHAATSRLDEGSTTPESSSFRAGIALPVDAAVSADGSTVAIVSAATGEVHVAPREGEPSSDAEDFEDFEEFGELCATAYTWRVADTVPGYVTARQPVALAFAGDDLIVQVRDPSAVMRVRLGAFPGGGYYPESADATVLPAADVTDSGHQSFHEAASSTIAAMEDEFAFGGATLACASCHPEGRDDGRTWSFAEIGPRRTQSVAGGILGTEPLHWDGDMDHFGTLVDSVFVRRMGAARPNDSRVSVMAAWIDSVPAPRPGRPVDVEAAERGRALFEDPRVGCADCHTGGATNNQTVDVGTGGRFQVPSLIGVSARAPYMHDGRAATLRDRFRDGGGDAHGRTSQLTDDQIGDLIAYLHTL